MSARVHKGPYDASPDRRRKASVIRKTRRRKAANTDHQTTAIKGRVVCWTCCKSAHSAEALARCKCVALGDRRHTLWCVGSCVFCTRCGARTSERVRQLGEVCRGGPASPATAFNLKCLKEGRLPGTRGVVAAPVPAPREVRECVSAGEARGEADGDGELVEFLSADLGAGDSVP